MQCWFILVRKVSPPGSALLVCRLWLRDSSLCSGEDIDEEKKEKRWNKKDSKYKWGGYIICTIIFEELGSNIVITQHYPTL